MNRWLGTGLAQADRVHLTAAGYNVLGGRFYKDLMEGMKRLGTGQRSDYLIMMN
jgi:hypothetical protein